MILAGDVGGTNARMAFFEVEDGRVRQVTETVFPSRQHSGLEEIVQKFVEKEKRSASAACFGIAGPVVNGRCETSNLPWIIETSRLAAILGFEQVMLINDLEANAWGIGGLEEKDLTPLNAVTGVAGNQAVVSAGTGLGEAGLYWDGTRHHVFACEGGHSDFAPRTDLEVDLLKYLMGRFGHVSYERILSGPGLVNVFSFLRDTGREKPSPAVTEEMTKSDPAAVISRAAMAGTCPLSVQALDMFISIYGAEASNMALKVMAVGGVFLGGGIAPRILAKLKGPLFMDAFRAKGRLQHLLEKVSVRVITNDKTALLGSARCAMVKLGGK